MTAPEPTAEPRLDALRAAERRLLDLVPTPIQAHDLSVAGQRIHYLTAGDPGLPPLVLLHGRGSSAALWYPIFPALAPHRRLIAVDLPGWGLSSRAPFSGTTGAQAIAWWRDAVLGTLDALGIGRFDLMGHSLGGMVSMAVALASQDRLDHLVLEDTGGFRGPIPVLVRLYFNLEPERLARLAPRRLVTRFLPGTPPGIGPAGPMAAAFRDFLYQLTTFPGTPASGARAFNTILDLRGAHFTMQDQVAGIHTPTRIIWGEQDGTVPIGIVRAGIRAMPNAELVVLPGLNHSPHLEAPAVFARAALEFLARGTESLPGVPPA